MKHVMPINKLVRMKRTDGANSFYCIFGDIEVNENGDYFYTEYAKENPRTIAVNDMPEECKTSVLELLQ